LGSVFWVNKSIANYFTFENSPFVRWDP